MQSLDEAIRERAYHLWIAGGCREGMADAHWLSAQRDVLATSLANSSTYTPSPRIEPAVVATDDKYPAKKVKVTSSRKTKRRAA